MPDMPKSFPNEYDEPNLTSTGQVAIAFGFNAGLVRIKNFGAGDTFISLGTTGLISSSQGYRLTSGETLAVDEMGAGIAGFSLWASTTGNIVSVGAWG